MDERETRSAQNLRAAEVIHSNLNIWRLVGGPDPEVVAQALRVAAERESVDFSREALALLRELAERGVREGRLRTPETWGLQRPHR